MSAEEVARAFIERAEIVLDQGGEWRLPEGDGEMFLVARAHLALRQALADLIEAAERVRAFENQGDARFILVPRLVWDEVRSATTTARSVLEGGKG